MADEWRKDERSWVLPEGATLLLLGFLLPFLLVAIPIGLSHRHSAEVRVPREVRGFSNFHPPGKRGPYETARVRRTCSPSPSPRPFRHGTSFPQTVECGPADWHGHSRTRRYKCVSYPHRILIVTYEKRPPWILRRNTPHHTPSTALPAPPGHHHSALFSYTPHFSLPCLSISSYLLPNNIILLPHPPIDSTSPPVNAPHRNREPRGERDQPFLPTLPPSPSDAAAARVRRGRPEAADRRGGLSCPTCNA